MKTLADHSLQYKRISLVGKILLIGFGASFVFNFVLGYLLKTGYPFNTFFFKPESKYLDFYYPYVIANDPFGAVKGDAFTGMNPFSLPDIISGQAWEVNYRGPLYFPFAYWIVLPFRMFSLVPSLFLFWVTTALIFVSVCYKHIRAAGGLFYTFVFMIFSYPLLFLLNRSNFEIAIFAFLYLFVHYYEKKEWLGSFSLAMAIAMKFLPLGYILIQLSDKKYKHAFFSAGAAFFLNLIAYALFPGGLVSNIRAHLFNLRISSLFYGLDGRNIAFNSNLSAGIKYIFLIIFPYSDLQVIGAQAENIANWIALFILIFTITLFVLKKMRYWEKVAVITCLILLVSSSTADYRLLLLYIPFFLWLPSPEKSQKDYVYSFLFGILFIPKSYMHIPAYPEVSVSIFLNPLLMLVMIFTIVFDIRYANDNNKVFASNAWMVWSKYKHIMTGFIFCVLVLALVLIADISTTDKKTSTNPDVIQKLESYAVHSENASDYRSSVGYYLQWVLLEPVNPESHIRLARSFSKTERDWLSYQEYKRAFFLSSEDSAFRLEAEDGIQTALSATVCDMVEKNEFKWSNLIQQEYNELFPHLPQTSTTNCKSK